MLQYAQSVLSYWSIAFRKAERLAYWAISQLFSLQDDQFSVAFPGSKVMPSSLIQEQSALQSQKRPEVRPGYTVRVFERIKEGDKERTQIFEGLVIAVHKGSTAADSTITVRKIASGVGVERVFPMHSPKIEKIEVKKVAKVRRAKLFFLRGRQGKSARMSERFTTSGEFAAAIPTHIAEREKLAAEQAAEEAKAAEEAAVAKAAEEAAAAKAAAEAPAPETPQA